MIYSLIRFAVYNKIYLIAGGLLLLLIFLPTKEKISAGTRKALYVFTVIWIICFAYKINTGRHIIYMFKSSSNGFGSSSTDFESKQTTGIKGPFDKYYSNEAGRKSK